MQVVCFVRLLQGHRGSRFDDPPGSFGLAMRITVAAEVATGERPRPVVAERWGVAVPLIDDSLAMTVLPTVLSLIAGSCDIITFVGLGGLFSAHITGNLV